MKKNLVLIGAVAISIVALSMTFIKSGEGNRMAYFDYNTVYNDCELKKELEKDLERVVSARKSDLDSMQLELSFLSTKIKSGESSQEEVDRFETLKGRFLSFQNQYEQENVRLKEQYFSQIRAKINEKAKEFGEEKQYDYLLSAIGDGSLMYAKESKDVTKEFLAFIDK